MTTYAQYPYAIGTEAMKLNTLGADPASDPAGSVCFTGDHFRGKRAAGWVDLDAQGSAGITIAATAPATPVQGQLWWRNDPDGNLYISYNDGNSTQWVPAVPSSAPMWTVSGATLTPTDATKGLKLTASADPLIVMGAATAKCTIGATTDYSNFSHNNPFSRQDTARAGWQLSMNVNSDLFQVWHSTAAGVVSTPLTLDATGQLTLPTAGWNPVTFGSRSVKGRLAAHPGADVVYLTGNAASGWVQDNAANSSWIIQMDVTSGGWFSLNRLAPGGASTIPLAITNIGNMILLGAYAEKNSGTVWANPSDIRIKKNITPYGAGLKELLQLQPVQFEHNGFADTVDGTVCWGYLADDVAAVMPECVSTHTKKLADEKEVDLQMLDTSNISLAVVNAIKELAARVTALEAR